MKWIKTNKKNHDFYKFETNEHMQSIEWAFKTAKAKIKNTVDSYKVRNPLQRFSNIFLGDLAKNLVKEFFINEIKDIKKVIKEYDLERKDNFIYLDKYDLKFENGITNFNIEIKSSGEKYSKNPGNFFDRRIIINKNNIHQKVEDFVFQVIFLPKNMSFFTDNNLEKYKNYDLNTALEYYKKDFIEEGIEGYLTGYADKKMQLEAMKTQFELEKRSYADLKISEAIPPKQFINEISNYLNEKQATKKEKNL